MNIHHYCSESDGRICFTREQGSNFAKQVAQDFNPLHDVDAKRFSNIVYGNFNYVLRDLAYKKKVSLSPQNPLDPRDVSLWCQQAGFIQLSKTGVRCFHDYLRDRSEQETEFDKLLEVELRYNRTEPYASLGRYQHLLLKK